MSETGVLPEKPIILILCSYYLPGKKGGGGVLTLTQMVERFKDRFDFRVITRNRDVDGAVYENVKSEDWNEIEGIPVYYLSKGFEFFKLRELIADTEPDAVYLNSVFSPLTVYYLILRRLKLLPPLLKTILAPNGELAENALKHKSYKKAPFIKLAQKLGLFRDLIWKTTAEPERMETENFKGSGGVVFVAPNLSPRELLRNYRQDAKPAKRVGEVRMIFLARYLRIKNFKWLIEQLINFEENLKIDIYGPIEDQLYWEESLAAIKRLPANVFVKYLGFLDYERVSETLLNYHFFVMPTLGENFGYVLIEALAAGCPLIISDRTPWRNLESEKVGWDISLNNPEKWVEVLRYCSKLDQVSYTVMSRNAHYFAAAKIAEPEIEESTLTVLNEALSSSQHKSPKSCG